MKPIGSPGPGQASPEGSGEVVVRSPSASRETAAVVQGCIAIVVMGFLVGALHRPSDAQEASLSPWQRLFREEPQDVQRVYRELLGALEEALRLRTPASEWPSVERLSAELVSPFSERGGRIWQFLRLRSVVNYLGRPRPGARSPAFLLHIQEDLPHPMNTPLDEFHRRTEDGALIHVGIWIRDAASSAPGVVVSPDREGWTEIVTGQDVGPAGRTAP